MDQNFVPQMYYWSALFADALALKCLSPGLKSWGRHHSLLLLHVKLVCVCVFSWLCLTLHNLMDYSLPGCKWFKMNDSNAEKNSP